MITQNYLKELLHYNPDTGLFTRLTSRGGAKAGAVAGGKHHSGYISIQVDGKLYAAHRLAWLYQFGHWPTDQLDHINGVCHHNAIANLRQATRSQNGQNTKMYNSNTSGFFGVSYYKASGKWLAKIKIGGKRKQLGYFNTPEEASEAYLKAKAIYHTFQPIPREAAYATV
jgi:hypothetical protein